MKSKCIRTLAAVLLAALILAAAAAALVYNGVILLNRPSKAAYPVRG